jgi:allantoinase
MILRGHRVILPEGERAASIHIDAEGVIANVSGYDDVSRAADVIDAGDLVVSPGIVDTHVHVNEPGRTEWEGFDTATRAAAAGGVTTIVDMPLNSIPATTDVQALEAKREAARGKCHVDVAFWGGIVPDNESHIEALVHAGVRGFKCFLTPSGVDEFPSVSESHLRRAMPILSRAAGRERPLLVHAEDPTRLRAAAGNPRAYATYLATRPGEAEAAAIAMMARLAAEYDVAIHIVHLSSREGVAAVERAQAAGARVTAETCPHYLTFAAAAIADGATAFKCAPPVRDQSHRDALWAALERGTVSMIATDHSPAPPSLKCLDRGHFGDFGDFGDFLRAWGGIASLELSVAAVWSQAAARGFGVHAVAAWMSANTARLAGLHDRKGAIRKGCDADLILWDPDAQFDVVPARLQQRHKVTPYAGRRLRGLVRRTYLRGVPVWEEGQIAASNRGRLL